MILAVDSLTEFYQSNDASTISPKRRFSEDNASSWRHGTTRQTTPTSSNIRPPAKMRMLARVQQPKSTACLPTMEASVCYTRAGMALEPFRCQPTRRSRCTRFIYTAIASICWSSLSIVRAPPPSAAPSSTGSTMHSSAQRRSHQR